MGMRTEDWLKAMRLPPRNLYFWAEAGKIKIRGEAWAITESVKAVLNKYRDEILAELIAEMNEKEGEEVVSEGLVS